MTHRQRFRAILDGKAPDRTAWVPRLDLWYNGRKHMGTLPAPVRGMTLFEVENYLGMGHAARKASVFKTQYDGVEERIVQEADRVIHTLSTPVGEISSLALDPPEQRARGMNRITQEHFIKSERDFEIMQYVAENTRYVPDYEAYRRYDAEVREDGYPLLILGPSPIHRIMISYLGYEQFYYWLADAPARIEALLAAMEQNYRQMWEVVAQSPAEFVMHGVHFSSSMTPPPIFRKYFVPYFTPFIERMHAAGIKVAFHADADLTGLLELVRDCGYDVADTMATAPLVRVTFDEARAVWKDRIVIWGGVPSTILEPSVPFKEFTAYMENLFAATQGRSHFIMAVSDNILPGAEFERLEWIRDSLAEHE